MWCVARVTCLVDIHKLCTKNDTETFNIPNNTLIFEPFNVLLIQCMPLIVSEFDQFDCENSHRR